MIHSHIGTALFACLLLHGTAAAQSFVLPPSANVVSSYQTNTTLLYGSRTTTWRRNEARTQILYDSTAIPIGAAVLKSLQFRTVTSTPIGPVQSPSTSIDLDINLSVSTTHHTAASKTFANNVGNAPAKVFKGKVHLPVGTSGTWPRPWQAAVPFTSPFVYIRTAGTSFVVDVVAKNSTSQYPWWLEEYGPDIGATRMYAPDIRCSTFNNRHPGIQFRPDHVILGGTFWHSSCCYANNTSLAQNAMVLGLRGPGEMAGNLRLPIDLQSLGISARPFCALMVDPLLTLPLKLTLGTGSAPTTRLSFGPVSIPNHPNFIHLEFFTQNLMMDSDPVTQAQAVYSSLAMKWRVGTGAKLPASNLYSRGDSTAANGSLYIGRAVTLRFNY